MPYRSPATPSLARLARSPAMATAGPAARGWVLKLLAEGDRAGTHEQPPTDNHPQPPPNSTLSWR
jgi:hypothetical protein